MSIRPSWSSCPPRIATLVVGNPLIADVSLQPGGVVVVTGKGYGATNVIAMDREGEVLIDRMIQVEGPTDQVVTIYRGVDRESYSCMPICQRRVTLGDGETYFKSTIEQAGKLQHKATGASRPPPRRTERRRRDRPTRVGVVDSSLTGAVHFVDNRRNTSTISFSTSLSAIAILRRGS